MSSRTKLFHNGNVIAGDETIANGWLLLEDGVIAGIGANGTSPVVSSKRWTSSGATSCQGLLIFTCTAGAGAASAPMRKRMPP